MSNLLPKPASGDAVSADVLNSDSSAKLTTRVLNEDDFIAFRTIRLEALKTEGEFFGPQYEDEKKLTVQQWRQRCAETQDGCFVGLFDKTELVGIMGVKKWNQEEETALWWSAYLKLEYRGRKLAAALYQAREKWTKRNSQYKRAVFFIREDNVRSRAIHEKQGAHYMYTEQMQWPDRPIVPWCWYKKELRP